MENLNILGIIPARYASTRFPGKPLTLIKGTAMIERVYRQCLKAGSLDHVCVATDDTRIFDHIVSFGGNVVMTSALHPSGTDRCLEAMNAFSKEHPEFKADVVINIQGDEPLINPEVIDNLAAVFADPEVRIATVSVPFNDLVKVQNPNYVKIVKDLHNNALYFSRSVIPYHRNNLPETKNFHKHLGIYGFRAETLETVCRLSVSALEMAESLEQLRWLENGFRIRVIECSVEGLCVDVPEDIQIVEDFMNKHRIL
jgi:3-deoxy-manno-octulosonate cytidylyltransferase (CMP-KDO synthetase)